MLIEINVLQFSHDMEERGEEKRRNIWGDNNAVG